MFKDATLYLANNYSTRLPSYEPLYSLHFSKYNEYSYFPLVIPMFVVAFCSFFTHCGSILISLNRFTAISLRTRYETVSFYRLVQRLVILSVLATNVSIFDLSCICFVDCVQLPNPPFYLQVH